MDSPEFAQKLERRKMLAEAAPPSPRHTAGGSVSGAIGLDDGTTSGGLSYLEMLAERIAARQQQS